GLHGWQIDLIQARARPGREEPQVVTDLRQLDGETFQDRGKKNERLGILCSFDQVCSQPDWFAAGLRQMAHTTFGVTGGSIQAGSDSCSAHVDFVEHRFYPL